MLKIIKYLKSGLALSAIVAVSMGLSSLAATADDKKEGQRVVEVDCGKGDEPQRVLDTYAFETKPLLLIIEGTCENAAVEVNRNNVGFVGAGAYEQRGYITGVFKVEGGRGVYIGDNMILDDLIVEYGQVFLYAGEGAITINAGVGVNFQSVLTIGAVGSEGSVIINPEFAVNLINQSLLLIQPDELATAGSVTTGNINASLQSAVRIRAASIGDMNLGSDSHAYFESGVLRNGFDPDTDKIPGPGILGCDDSHSRYWGVLVEETGFDVHASECIGM